MKKACGSHKAMHSKLKSHLKKDISRDKMDIKEDKAILKHVKAKSSKMAKKK